MAIGTLFGIVMIIMALLLFGAVFLARRRKGRMEVSTAGTRSGFRDCYDLCSADPKREPSLSCKTSCLSYGGA